MPDTIIDPVSGRSVRRLTEPPNENIHFYYDVSPWSPDGTRVLYASHQSGREGADISMVDLRDDSHATLTSISHFDAHAASHQMWLDDSTVVVPEQNSGVYKSMLVVDLDSGETSGVDVGGRLSKLNPARQKAALIQANGSEIGILDLDDLRYTRCLGLEEAREISPHSALIEGRRTELDNVRWSPDGRHLLMAHCSRDLAVTHESRADTVDGIHGFEDVLVEVFVYDFDAGEARHLARIGHHPTWHPTGEEVAYVYWDPSTKQQSLRSVSLDGQRDRVLFDAEHLPAGHPVFHPVNSNLVMTDCYGGRFGHSLALMDLDARSIETLVSHPTGEPPGSVDLPLEIGVPYRRWPRWNSHPVWSSDGSSVVYNDCTLGTPQLCLLDTSDLCREER